MLARQACKRRKGEREKINVTHRDHLPWQQSHPALQLDQCNVKGSCHLVKTLRMSFVGVWWDIILRVHVDPLVWHAHLKMPAVWENNWEF